MHAIVTGRVQGVYFRAHARREAQRLGLNGYARNRADGRVEVVAEGERVALDQLLAWLQRGSPDARVQSVAPAWERATGEFAAFEVRP